MVAIGHVHFIINWPRMNYPIMPANIYQIVNNFLPIDLVIFYNNTNRRVLYQDDSLEFEINNSKFASNLIFRSRVNLFLWLRVMGDR